MRRDEFDPVARAMATDAPSDHYEGPHWSQTRPEPGPEPTPLELMEKVSWFRRLQDVYMVFGVVAVLLVIGLVFRVLFLVVMSLW